MKEPGAQRVSEAGLGCRRPQTPAVIETVPRIREARMSFASSLCPDADGHHPVMVWRGGRREVGEEDSDARSVSLAARLG